MHQSLFETSWHQLRHQLQTWWAELTDADLDQGGHVEQFPGQWPVQYAYAQQRTEAECYRHLALRRAAQAQLKAELWAKFSLK